jgi:hypothetical protein
MVLNLNVATTEVDLLLAKVSRHALLPFSLLVLSIRLTLFDKAAKRERIFAIAFSTFYLIS